MGEELDQRETYKIYMHFDEENMTVDITAPHKEEIYFKNNVIPNYSVAEIMDSTRPYLMHRYVSFTIDYDFADAKEKHGMRYTKLRGLSKIEMEVSLIFSCMNLKKLANWMWKDTSSNLRLTPIFSILSLKIFIKKKIAILYKLKMAILSTI